MKKLPGLLLAALIFCCFSTNAQSPPSASDRSIVHEYFLDIEGVKTRDDVLSIESLVRSKPGVLFFLGQKFPVKYFVLRSNTVVDAKTFTGWLNGTSYTLLYIGEGDFGREQMFINKNKKKH